MKRGIWVRLFDLHCDTLGCLADGRKSAVDMRRGGCYDLWTQVFAAWLADGETPEQARGHCEMLLDSAWQLGRQAMRVEDRDSLCDTTHICRALLAVENGGATAADFPYLAYLYRRGVRLITLTWNGDGPWGSGCFGGTDGLTAYGKQAVRDMESLGITVDVSHLNAAGFRDVAAMATRPFIASHSNSYAVHPHPRNLTDAQFCAVRDSGGVVGLNLYGDHLGGWDFSAFQRHLEHFLALNGERTVCIGSDLDGMEIPDVWEGICVFDKLWQHLKGEGYPEPLLDAVFYSNAFAFFSKTLAAKT
ncbi:MAG: membrane dipeptidase [Clostridia bacterium]|nr:membrane dipeptidase [Clostridia bacterium]